MLDVTPQIVSGYRDERSGKKSLTTSSPTSTLGCALFSLIAGADDALKVIAATGATAAKYIVTGIYELDGVTIKKDGWLSNDEIATGSNHKLQVVPIGGVILSLAEDADGGAIADWEATPYVTLISANPGTAELQVAKTMPYGHARANLMIDSSTAHAETTSRLAQIIGLDTRVDNPTSGAKRYLVKVLDAAAERSQSDTF